MEQLRTEAKQAREKAKRSDYLETEVRRLAIREGTRTILTDPSALPWSDEFTGENGLPEQTKITEAAKALAKAQPWLARPRGDVGQGRHGTTDAPLSLSALLRS